MTISKSPCVYLGLKAEVFSGLLDAQSVQRTEVRGLSNTLTSRRKFLKTVGAGVIGGLTGLGLNGCGKGDSSIGPIRIAYFDEPEEEWENVDHLIDNTLEGGFSFNLRNLRGKGVEFGNIVDLGGETYILDAEGYSFSSLFNGTEREFAITSLRKNETGFVLDIMESPLILDFQKRNETKRVNVGGKDYEITFGDILNPQQNNDFYVPNSVFYVNGDSILLKEGFERADDIFMSPMLRSFHESGAIGVFLSNKCFSSCRHEGSDMKFSGLEHAVILKKEPRREIIGNRFNDKIQEDAYFRVNASLDEEKKVIVLNQLDKIRVADADIADYPSLPSRYPRTFEVLDDKERASYPIDLSIEGNFSLSFTKPLEARIDVPIFGEIALVPEFFNAESGDGKYLLRYFAFNSDKIPKRCQPKNLGKNYPPIRGVLTEILEEPQEIELALGEQRNIDVAGQQYSIKLKELKYLLGGFPWFDFVVEVEKGSVKEEGVTKILTHGYPNRINGINIDPNLAYYHGKDDYGIRDNPQRFFISQNKFSSPLSFGNNFSSLKKILIPDYEGNIQVLTPVNDGVNDGKYIVNIVPTGKVIYKQVTLAPRLNGKMQVYDSVNYGLRADLEFGVNFYEGSEKEGSTAYVINSKEGFDYSDQIRNGYVLRLKGIEKVFIEKYA